MTEIPKDFYQTIKSPVENILYKVKGSKFYGFVYHIAGEDQAKDYLATIKKEHYAARHWCYAWQLGVQPSIQYRVNDDGEPANTAGKPIHGQLQAFDLTNVLLVVVRYFGGTKLGVGGLIQAYKTSAKLTLEEANISQIQRTTPLTIQFEYPLLDKVMRIITQHEISIEDQQMKLDCQLTVAIRNSKFDIVRSLFEDFFGVTVLEDPK